MSNTTELIKDRLPIEDVVSQYVKLERAGKNLRGKCPFHNERTPSFFVSPDRGTYYCFGCGAGGDVFTFVEEFEGLDFRGALKVLAEKAGVELKKEDPRKRDKREKILGALEEASKFFIKNLTNSKDVLKYLESRGLEEKTLKEFALGYAPSEWRALREHMTTLGFSEAELSDSGLLVRKEGKSYDRFRGRIMFPIQDPSGRIVAFSGRLYPESEDNKAAPNAPSAQGQAKYVNTPETEVFHKSDVLYGYDKSKGYIRKYDFSIIVEGQMDLLMSHQAGYKNTVASSGTALTRSHFEKVNRISPNVVLALDADSAGELSTSRSAVEALGMGMDLKVARLPEGSDPADVIKENPENWKEVIKEAVHIVDFKLSNVVESKKPEREKVKAVTKEVLPFVKAIDNKIDQARFVKKVAEATSVSESAVYEELGKAKDLTDENEEQDGLGQEGPEKRRSGDVEERIITLLLWQKEKDNPQVNVSEYEERIKDITGKKNLPKEVSEDLVYEAESYFEEEDKVENVLEEMFAFLEKKYLAEEMRAIGEELKKAEEEGNDSGEILKKYQDLGRKLVEVENKLLKF